MRPATRTERAIVFALLTCAALYLVPFVPRGWFPHDEGMIGQSAARVLQGALPHVDYEEPYTGGLTYLYACVFQLAGIDLLYIRWLLFVAACLTHLIVYSILRRLLAPIAAAVTACVALTWSFPNYFAGLPSWWVLIGGVLSLWALIRHLETGHLRYAALAGLCVGLTIVVKQTGVYLFVPLVMSLWTISSEARPLTTSPKNDRRLRASVGLLAVSGAVLIMRSRLLPAEVIYLLVPIAASSFAFCTMDDEPAAATVSRLRVISVGVAAAAIPLTVLLLPYVATGTLHAFISGTFLLPQKRLTFASKLLPSAWLSLCGLVVILWTWPAPASFTKTQRHWLDGIRYGLGLAVAVASLYTTAAYQFVWQSSRALAALTPVIGAWLLSTGRGTSTERRILFATASMLAWASLVQFPFGAPIYFCYVAPLGVIAGAAAVCVAAETPKRSFAPWVTLVLIFAVVSMNRSYPGPLGIRHQPAQMDVPLRLRRAHLNVGPGDASMYRRTVTLVNLHLREGALVAAPDCPEVYFLTGQFSPSGSIFDFFGDQPGGSALLQGTAWSRASVIVINHRPEFSRRLPVTTVLALREMFPEGEINDRLEVRWR